MTAALTTPNQHLHDLSPAARRARPRRVPRRSDAACVQTPPRRAPLALAVALALGTGGLEAATFNVTTNADNGAGSLRQAVLDANAAAGADEITFADGLGTITLTGDQLDITETLTITGPAAGQIIDGDKANRTGRIFGVTSNTAALTLENLTLQNAKTTAEGSEDDCSKTAGRGGAICALGTLTLTNSTVSGNETSGNYAYGGGVYGSGAVTLANSTVSGNETSGDYGKGGGVYGSGAVTLTNSTVSGNETSGNYGRGGGVYGDGAVTLRDSTVSGNETSGDYGKGGGVCGDGTVILTNSTVSDNTAGGQSADSGGVYGDGVVMLTNSTVSGNTAADRGGGVQSKGGVTLTNSTVSGNKAGDWAGGVYSKPGTVTLTNSTVSDNTAGGRGGGVFGDGIVMLINSTVSDNTAGGIGGGIYCDDAVTLRDSTVSGNTGTDGGGVYGDVSVILINSTVSGNTATNRGGGIYSDDAVTLLNSTVSGNTASSKGGGVYCEFNSVTFDLTGSILAGNTVGGTPNDCEAKNGTATAIGSNNLIQATGKACGLTNGANGNIVGSDPLLAALADNGCVTKAGAPGSAACVQTHALRTGSPAFDAGSNPNDLATAQRGYPRQSGSGVDMGAVEFQSPLVTVTSGGSGNGTVSGNGLDCTLTAGATSGTCTATPDEETAVSLTAAATAGSRFSGWTDATCQGTANPCAFTLREAKTLTAVFEKSQYGLAVTGGGTGTGTISGNGLDCALTVGTASGTCITTLDHGTAVSLTAAASSGSTFGGWSDASCGTASQCSLTLTAAQSLTATFKQQTTTGGGTTTTGTGTTTTGTTGTTTTGTTGTTTTGTTTGTTSTGDTTTGGSCRATAITCSDSAKLWIHRAYRGYYGRCAECGGFRYWCERLEAEGGGTDLSPIIAAFGTSQEYTERFSGLSDAELIHNLYQNMFNRTAEPGGLAFYLELLEAYRTEWRDAHAGDDQGATEYGLSRIALDILLGTQNNDIDTLDAKLAACEQF
ncbi:right-handed parallel beta-helix repeat-containing protein [Candidatus Thiosymbion oneisti]|uniref:right-handed parallel beta-helix repeat-containing protein n=1 Tax=Candidatus Thiosymbion oneisti TaxID=589554 RepID=UPI000ABCB935|nr:choice-of-anchor Q domain-containing protein [Candidatus Thiosymbion oneisti]